MKLPRQFVHLDCLAEWQRENGALPIGPGNRFIREGLFGDKIIPTCALCSGPPGYESDLAEGVALALRYNADRRFVHEGTQPQGEPPTSRDA